MDLSPGPLLALGRALFGFTRAQERGRVLLELVENEFKLFGPTVGLRRLARTSCYFAKFVGDFHAFRQSLRKVYNLPQFRRLVREHFR